MSKAVQHLEIIGKNDEWETPISIFNRGIFLSEIYPKIDVCATRENRLASLYFTKEDDFLKQEVTRDFYMNAPYSKQEEMMRHAYEQHIKYNVNALILSFAKTDTKWWHRYVEGKAEVKFIQGRIKFNINGVSSKNSAPYPSCFIIYRAKKI